MCYFLENLWRNAKRLKRKEGKGEKCWIKVLKSQLKNRK